MYHMLFDVLIWFAAKKRRVMLVDFCCIALAVFIGYSMRFSYFFLGLDDGESFARTLAIFSIVVIGSLFVGKTYRVVWTRASIEEYARFAQCYFAGSAIFVTLNYFADIVRVPRSSFLILLMLSLIFMTGVRAAWRLAAVSRHRHGETTQRALIVGAGEAGTLIARDLLRNPSAIEAIGFIDDNPNLQKMTVASLKVLGSRKDLPALIKRYAIDTVLLAIPSATGAQLREYIDLLNNEQVTVRVLPSFLAIADGHASVSRLRSVKLEDLLRRAPIKLDEENISSVIKCKSVMVTGAGGSIGSEICRQVLAHEPQVLLALGHGEQSIYMLLESLHDEGVTIPIVPIIADVADAHTMRMIFEKHHPQVIFHAGAHKQVPLMEENPCEALRVNALGTWTVASLAGRFGVERFVMISTDKAVHPTSVMGATKCAAERLLLSVQQEFPATKYMAVRFGNVLGSRGSVVPKFERQIAAGGPVTVTHPDMKRYFMLIPEAVSLVLQAGAMGTGGELYVLDMGQPVKISDMAETLIRLHGYEPYKDIDIKYTGIRPGEKLYEELFYDTNHVDLTAHSKIFRTKLTPESKNILEDVCAILKAAEENRLSGNRLRGAILALSVDFCGLDE